MNTQKLTQKSLEAIQSANGLAIENQNQQIEQVHLLSALLGQEGGLIPQLFEKIGVSLDNRPDTAEKMRSTISRQLPEVDAKQMKYTFHRMLTVHCGRQKKRLPT